MDLDIEKLKNVGNKSKIALLSLGLGVSAAAGVAVFNDSPADNVYDAPVDQAQNAPQEISTQVDENRNKLDALTRTSGDGNMDYRLLGC